MELRLFVLKVTAKVSQDAATLTADLFTNDQRLIVVAAATDSIEIDGTSDGWAYFYYSDQDELFTLVFTSLFSIDVDTTSMDTIFIETDSAEIDTIDLRRDWDIEDLRLP